MRFHENFSIALRALRANKLRSLLTMLGIIIGVASVIAMISVGMGAQARVVEQIRSLGANLLMITPGAAQRGGVRLQSGSRQSLSEDDARALMINNPLLTVAAPTVRGRTQIVYGNRNHSTITAGTTADYFVAREWGLTSGRYFTPSEQHATAKVVLLGQSVAEALFEDNPAVGRKIRILNVPFEVIGVLNKKGASSTGADKDDVLFVPLSTAKLRLMGSAGRVHRGAVDYILIKVASGNLMESAQFQISSLLRQRHKLRNNEADDFKVSDPAAAMNTEREAARTFAWLLATIASVSLAVGGISIMNIMLVSVTERTREIGLRLALGAQRRHIRNQFLIEALTLCLLGGLIGIALGSAIAIGIARMTGWPILLGPEALLAALAFAAVVGVFFGYYPARKAALLDPIEALRFE